MEYMKRAIELAKKGAGYVSPNPMVGAVIVKNNKIIGEGWHMKYGEAHAEINAFGNCTESPEGAEMYVTLEPCSHYGKTPPCAERIVKEGIKKVYIGSLDTNPKVSGKGIEILRNAGIEVVTGVMENECKAINPIFFKYIEQHMPYVVLKSAMTLDGKIASYTGNSKWVTGEEARHIVHIMRHQLKGIMTGINTILADNPLLTCRIEGGMEPVKIMVDSKLKIPLDANVLKGRCIIGTTHNCDKTKQKALEKMGINIITTHGQDRVDVTELMKKLAEIKIDSILLEGGGTLSYSMLSEGLVDKAVFFIAPKIIGGENAKTPVEGNGIELMRNAIELENTNIKSIGRDFMIYGDVKNVHRDN